MDSQVDEQEKHDDECRRARVVKAEEVFQSDVRKLNEEARGKWDTTATTTSTGNVFRFRGRRFKVQAEEKDGACLFHVVSRQAMLMGFDKSVVGSAALLRKKIVSILEQLPTQIVEDWGRMEPIEGSKSVAKQRYLEYMRSASGWGGELEQIIAAELLRKRITVVPKLHNGKGHDAEGGILPIEEIVPLGMEEYYGSEVATNLFALENIMRRNMPYLEEDTSRAARDDKLLVPNNTADHQDPRDNVTDTIFTLHWVDFHFDSLIILPEDGESERNASDSGEPGLQPDKDVVQNVIQQSIARLQKWRPYRGPAWWDLQTQYPAAQVGVAII